jgi:hypothetical protein
MSIPFYKDLTKCAKITVMGGKIFSAFLVIMVSAILFMLPFTQMSYDFRTDERTDTFSTATALAVTSANETLLDDLFDDDTGSVGIVSDDATDVPLANSYNSTSRVLNITGLTANATRLLEITYDIDALQGTDAINNLVDQLPWIWLIVAIAFPGAALFAIFTGRV